MLAVADLTSSATSTSVDGNTEAVVVGADDSTATGDAAIGFNLDDAAETGLATIDGQALASLAATASTAAGVAGSGETQQPPAQNRLPALISTWCRVMSQRSVIQPRSQLLHR